MYYLLVEAAGMRQIARIHPERHREFILHLEAVMQRGGFSHVLSDGDLVLFQQDHAVSVQPVILSSVARSMMEALRSASEDLLDFLIVVDYREIENVQEELTQMQRLLRRARSQNAVYITEPVRSAIEPLIETESLADLHRVVAFTGGEHVVHRPYAESVAAEDLTRQISRALEPEPAPWTYLICPDTSRLAASLAAAAATLDPRDHIGVQCRAESTTETILQAVVAQLPEVRGDDHPRYGAEEIDLRERGALAALHDRFADPATLLLSEGWRRGELGMLLSRWTSAEAGRQQWVLVELRDIDLVQPEVARSVRHYLSPPGGSRAMRIVGTAAMKPLETAKPPDTKETNTDSDVTTISDAPPEVRVVELSGGDAHRFGGAHAYWADPDHDPRRLSAHHRHLIYLLYRLRGRLNDEAISPFVAALGITPAERVRVMQELKELGVVQDLWTSQVNPAAEPLMPAIVPLEDRGAVEDTIYAVMASQLRTEALQLSPAILAFLEEEHEVGRSRERRHTVLHTLAGGGAFDAVERIVGSDGSTPYHARATEASARIRLYLRDSRGPDFCEEDAAVLTTAAGDEALSPEQRADYVLSLGEFYLAQRNYAQALAAAKDATVLLQNVRAPGTGASHLLMARVLMVQRRLGDAGRYLTFAREEAHDDLATELIARSLEAIRLFLSGNLSRSATQFSELTVKLLASGFSEWLLLAWFALGRIDFELGAYHRAAAQFAMSQEWAQACGMGLPARTIGAWMLRSRYLADEEVPADYFSRDPAQMRAEEKLFVAEALITRNEYREALELLNAAEEEERDEARWPRLGVCWNSGYAPMEDLLIADQEGRSELLRMIQAFRAWMLSLTDRQDEAVAILYRLTRGYDGLSVDPYAGLFNYLYACILPAERSADRDDRTTVLGKSVKLVQERMSRIDDYRDKMRYLRSNTWNRRLMDAARRHNLVS